MKWRALRTTITARLNRTGVTDPGSSALLYLPLARTRSLLHLPSLSFPSYFKTGVVFLGPYLARQNALLIVLLFHTYNISTALSLTHSLIHSLYSLCTVCIQLVIFIPPILVWIGDRIFNLFFCLNLNYQKLLHLNLFLQSVTRYLYNELLYFSTFK